MCGQMLPDPDEQEHACRDIPDDIFLLDGRIVGKDRFVRVKTDKSISKGRDQKEFQKEEFPGKLGFAADQVPEVFEQGQQHAQGRDQAEQA